MNSPRPMWHGAYPAATPLFAPDLSVDVRMPRMVLSGERRTEVIALAEKRAAIRPTLMAKAA